ncbi:MAG: SMI1/KNR4 family protein [Planctomycetes bacterium]|nr:SMI1/KNR4 family protein [Planctomycetota bacterium]
MTSLAVLCQIMPPPDVPAESTGSWAKVESQLRTALPSDYKQFIETYGTGNIGSLPITVNSPFAIEPSNQLIAAAEGTLTAFRILQESGYDIPYSMSIARRRSRQTRLRSDGVRGCLTRRNWQVQAGITNLRQIGTVLRRSIPVRP